MTARQLLSVTLLSLVWKLVRVAVMSVPNNTEYIRNGMQHTDVLHTALQHYRSRGYDTNQKEENRRCAR
jgi:hypothetical protein